MQGSAEVNLRVELGNEKKRCEQSIQKLKELIIEKQRAKQEFKHIIKELTNVAKEKHRMEIKERKKVSAQLCQALRVGENFAEKLKDVNRERTQLVKDVVIRTQERNLLEGNLRKSVQECKISSKKFRQAIRTGEHLANKVRDLNDEQTRLLVSLGNMTHDRDQLTQKLINTEKAGEQSKEKMLGLELSSQQLIKKYRDAAIECEKLITDRDEAKQGCEQTTVEFSELTKKHAIVIGNLEIVTCEREQLRLELKQSKKEFKCVAADLCELEKGTEELVLEKKDMKAELECFHKEYDKVNADLTSKVKERETQLTLELNTAKEAFNTIEIECNLSRTKVASLSQQAQELQDCLNAQKVKQQSFEEEKKTLKEEIEKISQKNIKLEQDCNGYRNTIESMNVKIQVLSLAKSSLNDKIETCETDKNTLQQMKRELQEKYDQCKDEIISIKSKNCELQNELNKFIKQYQSKPSIFPSTDVAVSNVVVKNTPSEGLSTRMPESVETLPKTFVSMESYTAVSKIIDHPSSTSTNRNMITDPNDKLFGSQLSDCQNNFSRNASEKELSTVRSHLFVDQNNGKPNNESFVSTFEKQGKDSKINALEIISQDLIEKQLERVKMSTLKAAATTKRLALMQDRNKSNLNFHGRSQPKENISPSGQNLSSVKIDSISLHPSESQITHLSSEADRLSSLEKTEAFVLNILNSCGKPVEGSSTTKIY